MEKSLCYGTVSCCASTVGGKRVAIHCYRELGILIENFDISASSCPILMIFVSKWGFSRLPDSIMSLWIQSEVSKANNYDNNFFVKMSFVNTEIPTNTGL